MSGNEVRHPDVSVQLTGEDGNGFVIASRVRRALERAGHQADAEAFFTEALSGDYDHLLATCQQWVEVL